MLAELTCEELAAALECVAMEVLIEAGVQQPPVDAFAVARALGITVAADSPGRGRARYVRLSGYRGGRARPTILLRPEQRLERKQWAVAHEIGEHAAHRVFSALGADPRETSPGAREMVANRLAGRLLLPGEWFAADAGDCGWDLIRLKTRYATASHELIARRMLEFTPAVIVTIFDHGAVYFRRSNLPGRVPPPSSVEMECWQAVHQHNRALQSYHGPRTVCAWPVHEDGWKREIMRTEVEEYPL